MEDDIIFYGHLVHFTVFCYILWTFGIVRGNLVYVSPFWYFVPRKIWQTLHSAAALKGKVFFSANSEVLKQWKHCTS
jgi:hypothetical protein